MQSRVQWDRSIAMLMGMKRIRSRPVITHVGTMRKIDRIVSSMEELNQPSILSWLENNQAQKDRFWTLEAIHEIAYLEQLTRKRLFTPEELREAAKLVNYD